MQKPASVAFVLGVLIGAALTWLWFDDAAASPPQQDPPAEQPEHTPTKPPAPLTGAPSDGVTDAVSPSPEHKESRAPLEDRGLMPTAPLDKACKLVCRMVDEDGRPVRSKSLHVRAVFGTHQITGYTTTTPTGHFYFTIKGVLPPRIAGTLEIEPGRMTRGIVPYVPPPIGASAALPHPLPIGEVDLGEVVLKKRPMVGGGRVVDHQGNGIRGAKIAFTVWHRGREYPMGYDVKADADGRFELRHTTIPERASIRVRAHGYVAVPEHAIRVGDDTLRFELGKGVVVWGSFDCPAGGRPKLIELETSDGRRRPVSAGFGKVKERGWRFRFDNVPEGHAVLRYGKDPTTLKEVPVRISATAGGKYPELTNLIVE